MSNRISIVIPSFNQGRFLPETLDSIFGQSAPPFEVIVCDGASTDDSVDVLKRYAARYPQLKWTSEKDGGIAYGVNNGLAQVQGDWIGICSSDDLYRPGVFAEVAATAGLHPDCGFIYGDVEGVDIEGRHLGASTLPEFSWSAFFGMAMCIPQGSIFFRSELARKVGGWNPAYYGCDLDYWMRLLFHTRAVKIPRVLSDWRCYPEQRTRPDRFAKICADYTKMIDESEDVRTAPARVRRLAHASRHIMALRFHPTEDRWVLRRHLMSALLGNPMCWRYQPRSILLSLMPGYAVARSVYRRFVPRPTVAGT